MISSLLAEVKPITVFSLGGILVLLVYVFFMCLIIIGLIRLVRFLGSASKEIKLTRIEVGKLAEEVHLLRQELESGKEQKSPFES